MELELLLEKVFISCKELFKSRRKIFENNIYGIQYFSFIILEKDSELWKCSILEDAIKLLRFLFDQNKCFASLTSERFYLSILWKFWYFSSGVYEIDISRSCEGLSRHPPTAHDG